MSGLTIDLDGEDTLVASCPERGSNARFTQEAVRVDVTPGGELRLAHGAGEAAVVPGEAVTQSDLLQADTQYSPTNTKHYFSHLHPCFAALALVQPVVLLEVLLGPGQRNISSSPDNMSQSVSREKVKTLSGLDYKISDHGKTLSARIPSWNFLQTKKNRPDDYIFPSDLHRR